MNYLSLQKTVLLLTLLQSAPVLAESSAPAARLEVSPNRCVALHRGQTCYLKARFQWSATRAGHYCLHLSGTATPLRCWPQSDRGEHVVEVQSADNVRYELRSNDSTEVLAAADVEVAWVYNSPRRSKANWRLF